MMEDFDLDSFVLGEIDVDPIIETLAVSGVPLLLKLADKLLDRFPLSPKKTSSGTTGPGKGKSAAKRSRQRRTPRASPTQIEDPVIALKIKEALAVKKEVLTRQKNVHKIRAVIAQKEGEETQFDKTRLREETRELQAQARKLQYLIQEVEARKISITGLG